MLQNSELSLSEMYFYSLEIYEEKSHGAGVIVQLVGHLLALHTTDSVFHMVP